MLDPQEADSVPSLDDFLHCSGEKSKKSMNAVAMSISKPHPRVTATEEP